MQKANRINFSLTGDNGLGKRAEKYDAVVFG